MPIKQNTAKNIVMNPGVAFPSKTALVNEMKINPGPSSS